MTTKFPLPIFSHPSVVLTLWIVFLFMAIPAFAESETDISYERWLGVTGIFFAYITGIALSFTPCVWPIYPITSSVILNSSSIKTKKMAFLLSVIYVLGLAVTYSILGAFTGKMGSLVSNYLKSLWIVSALSLLLIIFGLSMLGLFEIRIPSSLNIKFSGKQRGFVGVFLMGLLSGLVLTPCVTPVVGALVAFIIKSGSWIVGALYFFAFALGMGTILIVIGTLSGSLNALPRPGKWMLHVKRAFGVVMIGVALFIAWPIVASAVKDKTESGETSSSPPPQEETEEKTVEQKRIGWIHDLQKGLDQAKAQGKPALIDFTADWCTYCKVMDDNTFTDERVIEETRRFTLIKFDATQPTSDVQKVLEDYQITGFPCFVIVDTNGKRHPLIGYVKPDIFLNFMKKAAPPGQQQAAPKPAATSSAASEKTSQKKEPENKIKWIHNFEEGIMLARMENKPVMIDFYADWCHYCKVLDKNVFTDKAVIERSRDFVMIKYDTTNMTPEANQRLREFQITGFPTTIFIDTQGKFHSLVGYVPAKEFLEYMNKIN
ncbi:thioredoxin family protein [Candidatus Sumerlaeota bacterium]|nr:thioredoxin family protein [Candidatus Sumerlaeota bacterium]